MKHFFKRLWLKIVISLKFDRKDNSIPRSEYEKEALRITRSLIKKEDSEVIMNPMNSKRYIKNYNAKMYIIISDNCIDIINHTYHYNVPISPRSHDRILNVANSRINTERELMESEIKSNVQNSLQTILSKIN